MADPLSHFLNCHAPSTKDFRILNTWSAKHVPTVRASLLLQEVSRDAAGFGLLSKIQVSDWPSMNYVVPGGKVPGVAHYVFASLMAAHVNRPSCPSPTRAVLPLKGFAGKCA